MKDEVPPAIVDAHTKTVVTATKEGKAVDPNYGLEKSGIAGTGKKVSYVCMWWNLLCIAYFMQQNKSDKLDAWFIKHSTVHHK